MPGRSGPSSSTGAGWRCNRAGGRGSASCRKAATDRAAAGILVDGRQPGGRGGLLPTDLAAFGLEGTTRRAAAAARCGYSGRGARCGARSLRRCHRARGFVMARRTSARSIQRTTRTATNTCTSSMSLPSTSGVHAARVATERRARDRVAEASPPTPIRDPLVRGRAARALQAHKAPGGLQAQPSSFDMNDWSDDQAPRVVHAHGADRERVRPRTRLALGRHERNARDLAPRRV